MPVTSQLPTTQLSHSTQLPRTVPRTTDPSPQATVHRTANPAPQGKGHRSDVSLQVCTEIISERCTDNICSWEPHVLFPEICTPPAPKCHKVGNACSTKGKRVSEQTNNVPPVQIRRSNRNKTNKKKNVKNGLVDLDAQAYFDVPLQYAEGVQMLALIGAADVPIPAHVMPALQQLSPRNNGAQST